MPIKPVQEFGAAYSNAATSEYPSGSYKDETVPLVSRDGSPLVAVTENDRLGFDEALSAEVGMTFTNVPDTALSSQRLEAHKKLIDQRVDLSRLIVSFDDVTDMLSASGINVGQHLNSGFTSWVTTATPLSLTNIEPRSKVCVNDFSLTTQGFEDAMSFNGGVTVLESGDVTGTVNVALRQSVTGISQESTKLNFSGDGFKFTGPLTSVKDIGVTGTKQSITLDPTVGTLGNVGVTHQENPNSGVSTMSMLISGFNTGYSEISTDGVVWTGAYRKIIDSRIEYNDIGLSLVGGSTDLRISSTDIRNNTKNGVYVECLGGIQYANVRVSNCLFESNGTVGNLTGTYKDTGIYIGDSSALSMSESYIENMNVCVDEGGSFSIDNSYKSTGSRFFGLGKIEINGAYDRYPVEISKDIDTGWTPTNCAVTYNTDSHLSGGSFSIKPAMDGVNNVISDYDVNIQKGLTVNSTTKTFLFVSCEVRVPTKPTGNWFGPLLKASFVDTGSTSWTNNIDLDMDPDMLKTVSDKWCYVNYIIPVRFGTLGLSPTESLKWVRLELSLTESGYTVATDGQYEVQVKNVKCELYSPGA